MSDGQEIDSRREVTAGAAEFRNKRKGVTGMKYEEISEAQALLFIDLCEKEQLD